MATIESLKEQNPWWIAKEKIEEDVNIEKIAGVKFQWEPRVLDTFNLEKDVIYTLRGSRQVGKTTSIKLLIKRLLKNNKKENIFYFTCNNVDTYHDIIDIIRIYRDWLEQGERKFIFIDEITFVPNWTKAVKHLADIGHLRNCTMVLTGSNAHDLKYEIERMPGRRGEDPDLDKILFPVSFREYVSFIAPRIIDSFSTIDTAQKNYPFHQKELSKYLENYLLTGGYIQAINSFAANGKVSTDIYLQYLSWTLGDLAKMGKRELFSRQILNQVILCLSSNIGYDTIAKKTSIESHLTVGEYIDLMESNFIIKVLYQIDMNRGIAASRKSKKIYFQDPFLFWVFLGYTLGLPDYFLASYTRIKDEIIKSKLIENAILTNLMRLENTTTWSNVVFFFRTANQVEVDFVVKNATRGLVPIEVKYKEGARMSDLRHCGNVNREKGILISKNTFLVEGNKIIIPAEAFMVMQPEALDM
jgi:hypothetical protein